MRTKLLSTVFVIALSWLPAAAIVGDVNGDGAVTSTDVAEVVNVLAGLSTNAAADVNGDGEVTSADVGMIVNILAGLYVPEPEPEPVDGYAYVWNHSVIPEIHILVKPKDWNELLSNYDANPHTKQYIVASQFTYIKGGETTVIDSVGLRLKGNTSRRRPEGWQGEMHHANPDWHHAHFGINLRKYHKDEDHTIEGIRKLHLKWFKDDPNYVRELMCFNTFRDFGVWTAPRSVYCRLWLKVEGDPQEAYFGVYEMNEPIDENYLKNRNTEDLYGTHKGNLWKCKYVNGQAALNNTNADFWYDDDSDDNHTYTLETNTKRFDNAKAQIVDFMLKLNGKGRESFYNWIQQVCDVDFLLRTYATSVALGSWDDYWNNGNNYYLYFTTEDIYDYKIYFIPYDYDNTLGTSTNCGAQTDAGRQNPLQWGMTTIPLIQRLMDYEDFRAIYVKYLKELVDPTTGPLHYNQATERIKELQERIRPYVSNDTGEDMSIYDEPAGWGHNGDYRLLQDSQRNNFFRVKTETINALQ